MTQATGRPMTMQKAGRGRPRVHKPGEVARSRIEAALSNAALRVARAQQISFESAFAKVIATPAGGELYENLRAFAHIGGR